MIPAPSTDQERAKHASKQRRRRAEHPERVRAAARRRYAADPTKKRESAKLYRARHREIANAVNLAWRQRNPEKVKEYTRRWREKTGVPVPVMQRRNYLKRTYGLTLAQFDALLAAQGGVCAICGDSKSGTGRRSFSVDHDAVAGVIRGVLCGPCNTGIGLLRHDAIRLAKAIEYLKAPPCSTLSVLLTMPVVV